MHCAGAGSFEAAHISLTQGMYLGREQDVAEKLMMHLVDIKQRENEIIPENGTAQGHHEIMQAMKFQA